MDKWSKEERNQLCKFWKGKIGKKYIERMEETRKQLLQHSMCSAEPNEAFRYSCIANGFDSVLQDIEMVIKAEEEEKGKEKEGVAEKK